MAKDLIKIEEIGNTFLYKDNDGVLYGSQQWHLPHDTEPVELTHRGNPEDYDFNIPHDGFEAIAAEENLGLPIVVFKNVGPTSNWWYAKEIGDFYFQEFWYDWKTTGFGYEIKANETDRIHEHEIIFIHDFDGDGFIGKPVPSGGINKPEPSGGINKPDEIDRLAITKQLININANSNDSLRGNRSPEFSGLASKNIKLLIELRDNNLKIIANKTIRSDENGVWRTKFDEPFSDLGYTPNEEVFSIVVHQIRSDGSDVLDHEPLEFIVDLSRPEPIRLSGIEAISNNKSKTLNKQELNHNNLGKIDVYVANPNDVLHFSGASNLLQKSFKTRGGIKLKVVVRDEQGKEISSQIYQDNVALTHEIENQWKFKSELGEDKLYQYDLYHIDSAGNQSDPHTEFIYVANGNIDHVKLAESSRSNHSLAQKYEITNKRQPTLEVSVSNDIHRAIAYDVEGNFLRSYTKRPQDDYVYLRIDTNHKSRESADGEYKYTIHGLDENNIIIAEENKSFILDTVQEKARSSSVRSQLLDYVYGKRKGEEFGNSVTISKNGLFVAASAPQRLLSKTKNKGAIDVFKTIDSVNLQPISPSIENPEESDNFGYALQIAGNGSIVYASSPESSGKTNHNKGKIYVFKLSNNNQGQWNLIQTISSDEKGILGLELDIDRKNKKLKVSLGPDKKTISNHLIFNYDDNNGKLTDPKLEKLDTIQLHDQQVNRVARQSDDTDNPLTNIGRTIIGDPTSSLNGINNGLITYNDATNLLATLLNDKGEEIDEASKNQYITNSNPILFSGNSPESNAEVEYSIVGNNNFSKTGKLIVDSFGDWSFKAEFPNEGLYNLEILTKDIAGNKISPYQETRAQINIDRTATKPFNITLEGQKKKYTEEILVEQSINANIDKRKKIYQLEGTAEPFSQVNIYYKRKGDVDDWKLSSSQILSDTNTWKYNLFHAKDQAIVSKKKGLQTSKFLVEIIPQKSGPRPIFSGMGEVGGSIELFARNLDQPTDHGGWNLVGHNYSDLKGEWRVTPDKELERGYYDFGFKFTDQAGNSSEKIQWSKEIGGNIHIDEDTTILLNPKLSVGNDSRFFEEVIKGVVSDQKPTINNKAGFTTGGLRKTFGSIPWKVGKAIYGINKPRKPQVVKDLERTNQLYKIITKASKNWSKTNEENVGYNVFTTLAGASSAIEVIKDTINDRLTNKEVQFIREFHKRLQRNENNTTSNPTYPTGLGSRDFISEKSPKKIIENHEKFIAYHQTQFGLAAELEKESEKEWLLAKKALATEKKNSPLYLDDASEIVSEAMYERHRLKEKKLENRINKAWITMQKSRNDQTFYRHHNINTEFTRSQSYKSSLEKYKKQSTALKFTNPVLGIGSTAFNFTASDKNKNDLFNWQQGVGFGQDITSILDVAFEGAKTSKPKLLINADGTVSKTSKKVSTGLTALGTGLAVAGTSLEIGNYANRIEEIKAIDCNKYHNTKSAIDTCNRNNKLDIEALERDIALRGAEAGLATIEGAMSVASTAAKAGTKAAKFLKFGGPVIGAAATAISLFDESHVREFEKKQGRINGIKQKIGTEFSASLLAEGLTNQLNLQQNYNTANKIIEGVTGIGSVIASVVPGGQPVALAATLLGSAITTALTFIESENLRKEALKIKNKMKRNQWGDPQSIEDFFEGDFLQQQQDLYKKIEPRVDELLSKGAFDQVTTLNSQFLSSTSTDLAGFTDSGGELGKSAKHFVASRKAGGDKNWRNDQATLNPDTGRIDLRGYTGGNAYVSFFAPFNASGRESWKKIKKGKNEILHEITIKDLGGWDIHDRGNMNSTFDLNENIVTQAYKSMKDQNDNKLTKVPISIYGGNGRDQYYSNLAGVTFHGGGDANGLNYPERYDSASYNTPNFVKKLANGVIIIPSQSSETNSLKSVDKNARFQLLEEHLKNAENKAWGLPFDWGEITMTDKLEKDIDDILKIAKNYKGPRSCRPCAGTSTRVLVIKPMKEGVTYFKNSIKTHTEKVDDGGKAKKIKKFQYQNIDTATNKTSQRIQDQLESVDIIATTPKADFVDLTGMATVQQLFTGDGNDHVFTGSNPRGLHIDTGKGNDTIYITTKIKTLITGYGTDHIYLKPEFLNNKPNPIGYYFKPSYHKNGDQIIKALTFIDGDVKDTLEIDHKLLKIILEEHSQEIYNRQASGDLARIMGGESDELGKKLYSMLPPVDSKINTHVKGIGFFKYTLPKNKKDWMPSLRASQLKRKKESVDLNYSTPALNGLSTGDSQLDSMIFIDDYKSAFNSVFKSKVQGFNFSAEDTSQDLFIIGTEKGDVITSGKGDDVIDGGAGINRITSHGNDIIYAGSSRDLNFLEGDGHRFIVGLTPDDLQNDYFELGKLSRFEREKHPKTNGINRHIYKHNTNLILGSGNLTLTIVDFFKHKDIRFHRSMMYDDWPTSSYGFKKFAIDSKSSKGALDGYFSFLDQSELHREVSELNAFKSADAIQVATMNSFNV